MLSLLTSGLRLITSRTGLVIVVLAGLFAWIEFDKRSAVRQAVSGYVADVELAANNAEVEALKARIRAAEQANQTLAERIQVAEGEAKRNEMEIDEYVEKTQGLSDCVIDHSFIERLRNP